MFDVCEDSSKCEKRLCPAGSSRFPCLLGPCLRVSDVKLYHLSALPVSGDWLEFKFLLGLDLALDLLYMGLRASLDPNQRSVLLHKAFKYLSL